MSITVKWAEDKGQDIENRPIEIIEKKTVETPQRVTIRGLRQRIEEFDRQIAEIGKRKAEVEAHIKEVQKALGIDK